MSLNNTPDPNETAIFGALDTSNESTESFIRRPLSATDQAAVDALPYGSALLIVQRGPNSGARFLLDKEVTTAGRSPKADIFLDDVTVSRRHCEFRAVDAGFIVRDSGSLNGTYVNRERTESAELHTGDEVQVGKYRLTYHPSNKAS
ncbi:FHA domain-containing protein [Actinomyces urinae]|uniref:FHA domain-containing protein n=1 Tax=Actinomyces urinae TaxID=1689268 RepID=UPI000931883E|nr:FHA domain-containing protein [Actinomyces urinae]